MNNRSFGSFADKFIGKRFVVLYGNANDAARILAEECRELQTLMAFWFAFHADSIIYSAE